MSTIIMAKCWPLQGMSPAQKSVLISLADQANDDGVCWPSISAIAKRTCLSERAVQDAIAWLQTAGVLFREYRMNTSTSYTIFPGRFDPAKAPVASRRTVRRSSTGADAAPGGANAAPGADAAPGGANAAPLGVQMPHPRGADAAPKSSLNRNGTINEPSLFALPREKDTQKPRLTCLPEDFQPDSTAVQTAAELGLALDVELEAFADHHTAKASRFADWQAALRTWLRNAAKYRERDGVRASAQAETPYQRSMRERMQEAVPAIARKAPGAPQVQAVDFFQTVEAAPELRRIGGAA